MNNPKNIKILVLGAGFAGIYAAINLSKKLKKRKDIEITLVDGNRYHLFKPMLHEVATGSVDPTHIIQPIRTVMKGRGFFFVEGIVQRIDLHERKAYMCSECAYCSKVKEMNIAEFDIPRPCLKPLKRKELDYDYLVLALGGMPNFYKIPGVEEFAFPLYSLEDAVRIREHVSRAFEIADHIEDPEMRKRLLTFIVAGAGPTGIELITELHDWIYHTLVQTFENVGEGDPRLILVEAGHDILPFSAENIRRDANKTLAEMKIEIIVDSPVSRLEKNLVETGGKNPRKIDTSTLVWAAGVKGNELIEKLEVEKDRIGRVVVNENLEVPAFSKVYAVGDCAHFQAEGHDHPLPQTGQVAVQQAACLVENIYRDINGRPKKAFRYRELGSMVSLGERTAVSNIFGYIGLSGFMGWLTWKLVYLKHLMGIQRKPRVILEWFFDITYDREASRHKFG
ncbi:MAG: NAD(P)/FAD-dependent oxidoreductase [Deltaproteobacteria bacterium]|nr:NAD(P)/FAD-dependent oxidoreductase [Deltaproteobacteria bacterium]